ncbi:hypothetical protein C2G38_2154064 [Gigaspora rosea]|uniref:Uncharacterized protein n=1 Tax=Gigaspora rosea TaxID=44941 RepID=A0A397WCR3_9GLOM|nr:hypothetical protein C2G38_2154064 [Gigaspora rosea]
MACLWHAIVACHKWHAKDPHAENPSSQAGSDYAERIDLEVFLTKERKRRRKEKKIRTSP